jgi:hypothetical protein
MKNKLLFMTMAVLGFAATTITLFSHQVFADKPSNPNCVGEEFSFFAKNTPRGAGDDASALAHEEPRGLGDNVREFRQSC